MRDVDSDLQRDAVFRVGRVTGVEGRRISVQVDRLKNGAHLLYRGGIVRNVAVASYIKISKGFVELIAKVDGEHVDENRAVSNAFRTDDDKVFRTLDVSLIGYLENGKFERGVREMPLLDNECFILSETEFGLVHTFVEPGDASIEIGTLAMEPTQRVVVGVDEIFGSHVGIFGNTGSGKSYTLTKLYHELFDAFGASPGFRERSQFVLIDFNGEYVDKPGKPGDRSTTVMTTPENKREYVLSTHLKDGGAKIPLPSTAVEDVTFWSVLLDATEKTQAPFLARVLASDFWERRLANPADLLDVIGEMVLRATKSNDVSIDRQTVINLMLEVQTCLGPHAPVELDALLDDFQANLHYNSTLRKFYWGAWGNPPLDPDNPRWQGLTKDKITALPVDFSHVREGIDLVRFKIVLQYYSDIISGYSNREHLSPLIKRLETRVPDVKKLIEISDAPLADRPLAVVSLRDVNLSMRKVIPMLLCKYLYDEKKESDPSNERYLNLIIDEAHNILSTESSRESEAWRDYRLETFEEIIKEGRKFGVFLTISSQRPHDISETIISQLHNYFLHRLINNLDIHAVEKAVAYLDRVSFESLPILPTGACVIAGVSAQVPVVARIAPLSEQFEPNSRTMSVTTEWSKGPIAPEPGRATLPETPQPPSAADAVPPF
ncbi:MAG: DUF87 domain-containing protein [Microbacterium sp.]|jgi:uncharacterized protein|uniref:ATP-binding protein n=1 Tax=Microbacterium sp. TaxID=51671 RepID=UPI003241FACD|tara:strand:- start:1847 stop:3835 length:1989 start_codon:yes stop_codon:yes gene_type:complete